MPNTSVPHRKMRMSPSGDKNPGPNDTSDDSGR